ncbi:hypothetical protein ACA910_013299 [Epithemia clementina (nom. ined.)]
MVVLPKVLSNKTVLTGLAQSPLRSASLFKPLQSGSATFPIGSKADVMGKAAGIQPTFAPGKIKNFQADMKSYISYAPSNVGRPTFIQSYGVSFR